MAETTTSIETLRKLGASAAILEATVLGAGIIGLIVVSPVLRPWLAVLFGINAALGELSLDALDAINAIDIVVLALAAVASSGLWPGPANRHRAWMGLAILLPLAGIVVLLVTGQWGRSGLMGGGLVLSVVLLGERTLRNLGYLGGVANLLLLLGDFATTGAGSALVAGVVAVGYILLILWFALMAGRLLSPGPSSEDEWRPTAPSPGESSATASDPDRDDTSPPSASSE